MLAETLKPDPTERRSPPEIALQDALREVFKIALESGCEDPAEVATALELVREEAELAGTTMGAGYMLRDGSESRDPVFFLPEAESISLGTDLVGSYMVVHGHSVDGPRDAILRPGSEFTISPQLPLED